MTRRSSEGTGTGAGGERARAFVRRRDDRKSESARHPERGYEGVEEEGRPRRRGRRWKRIVSRVV